MINVFEPFEMRQNLQSRTERKKKKTQKDQSLVFLMKMQTYITCTEQNND